MGSSPPSRFPPKTKAVIRDPWHPTEPSDDVHLEGYGLVTMPDWEIQRPSDLVAATVATCGLMDDLNRD